MVMAIMRRISLSLIYSLKTLFFVIFLSYLTACTGATSSEITDILSGTADGTGGGNEATAETVETVDDSADDTGTADSSPVVSLPLPTATKFTVSSVDGDSTSTAIATGGLLPEYGLLVSNQDGAARYIKSQNTMLAKLKRGVKNLAEGFIKSKPVSFALARFDVEPTQFMKNLGFINTAHAQSAEDMCPATLSSQTCITINEDGSIDDTALEDYANGDTVTLAYYDLTTGDVGGSVSDTVRSGVIYTNQNASSENTLTTDSDGNLIQATEYDDGTATGTRLVKLKYTDSSGAFIQNSGNFDDNYAMATVATEFSGIFFNSGRGTLQLRDDDSVHSYSTSSCEESATSGDCTLTTDTYDTDDYCTSDGCTFAAVKNKSNMGYFSVSYDSDQTSGTIYEIYNDEDSGDAGEVDTSIRFLHASFSLYDADDFSSEVTSVSFQSTIAFDVNYNSTDGYFEDVLVLIEDSSETTRLVGFYKNDRETNAAITKEFSDLSSATDLIVYSPQPFNESDGTETGESGNAMLLLSGSSPSVEFLDYDLIHTVCTEDMVEEEECNEVMDDSVELSVDSDSGISLSSTPVSWVVNTNKTIAYVLSTTDITVVDITNKTTLGTISLSSAYGEDKSFEITPKSIIFTNNTLLVGADGIGSLLVYDVSDYES